MDILYTPQIKDALGDALGDGIYLGLLLNDFAIWQLSGNCLAPI